MRCTLAALASIISSMLINSEDHWRVSEIRSNQFNSESVMERGVGAERLIESIIDGRKRVERYQGLFMPLELFLCRTSRESQQTGGRYWCHHIGPNIFSGVKNTRKQRNVLPAEIKLQRGCWDEWKRYWGIHLFHSEVDFKAARVRRLNPQRGLLMPAQFLRSVADSVSAPRRLRDAPKQKVPEI